MHAIKGIVPHGIGVVSKAILNEGQVMGRVSQIVLGGYKCLDRVEISPVESVNILTGRNNVGKSAVLQILYALPEPGDITNPRQAKRGISILGLRGSVSPWVRITTEVPRSELEAAVLSLPHNAKDDGRAHRLEQIWAQQVFGAITWVLRCGPRPSQPHAKSQPLRLKNVGPADSNFKESEKVASISRGPDDVVRAYLASGDLSAFQKWASAWKRGSNSAAILGKIGEAPTIPATLQPHWQALQSFLGKKRFFLRAQRHAAATGPAVRTESLAEDAENLAPRVHHLRSGEGSTFERIRNLVSSIVGGIRDIEAPFVPDGLRDRTHVLLHVGQDRFLLSESGTGVEQLMALATVLFAEGPDTLILLEEPENHLHPGGQERLLDALSQNLGQRHAFITTHSPTIAQARRDATLVSLRAQRGGLAKGVSVAGADVADIFRDLGVRASHFLLADVLVLVEGQTGVGVVEEWIKHWQPLDPLRDRARILVHTFQASDAARDDFDLDKFLRLNRNLVFFADRDEDPDTNEPNRARQALQDKCSRHDPLVPCLIVQGSRAIEDLFPERAIREAGVPGVDGWRYGNGTGSSPITDLARHTGNKWGRNLKNTWNSRIAEKMTYEEIQAAADAARLMEAITAQARKAACEETPRA